MKNEISIDERKIAHSKHYIEQVKTGQLPAIGTVLEVIWLGSDMYLGESAVVVDYALMRKHPLVKINVDGYTKPLVLSVSRLSMLWLRNTDGAHSWCVQY